MSPVTPFFCFVQEWEDRLAERGRPVWGQMRDTHWFYFGPPAHTVQCEVRTTMDEYYRLAAALPQPLAGELGKLSPRYAPYVQEIRLRRGQPVLFTVQGRLTPCAKFLPGARRAAHIGEADLQACFLHLCQHSVYAYEEELRQGFFTVEGGNRIGVAGSWGGSGFSAVTSLNLRVARWVTCDVPQPVQQYLAEGSGSLLVAGAPGSGKTTFLRTLVQLLSRKDAVVCVVDERCELMAGEGGGGLPTAGMRCDVYTRCPKAEGIEMALRCMNPAFIVCDELGTAQDAAAVERGLATGVRFLASIHCDTPETLRQKPFLQQLLQAGAFRQAVFLDGREKPGTMAEWVALP